MRSREQGGRRQVPERDWLSRRDLADSVARWVVAAGGSAVIASIIGIFGFICLEVYPLFTLPSAETSGRFARRAGAAVTAVLVDEGFDEVALFRADGRVGYVDRRTGDPDGGEPVPGFAGSTVAAAAVAGDDYVWLVDDQGRLQALRLTFRVDYQGGERIVRPRLSDIGAWNLGVRPRRLAASIPREGEATVAYVDAEGRAVAWRRRVKKSLFGEGEVQETRVPLTRSGEGEVTAIEVSVDGEQVLVGDARGRLALWSLRDVDRPRRIDTARMSADGTAVSALRFLLGEQAAVVGSDSGRVAVWFPVPDPQRVSGRRLRRVHSLRSHERAVVAIAISRRDRGFLTADAAGEILLHHSTTEQTLLRVDAGGPVEELVFAPKANGVLAVNDSGEVRSWRLDNPHPEATLGTLFGKVWYEGYAHPEYVWQSSGGSDAFEPKLSLVPLIVGTMKGTLYALIFAVPLAVFGALYTSQFSHPRVRGMIKPTVEIMAALPSVVLGFLAGLWLAPAIEPRMPGVLSMILLAPVVVFLAGVGWQQAPARLRRSMPVGGEVLLLSVLVACVAAVCLRASPWMESALFGGNFRDWLFNEAHLAYDQRNCIVVGFAMGFAVIPIIFTISEDALSNVPQRLVSASLGLGATRWQTAVRVVLPTASAGIFSAIMIGFGRAVGETMIVLMATGNTPILDWNIFTGMRTLSANIAVEIPEAPHGSTLYRVLFLAGLLLFLATFVVNTLAELVRTRLRRRYQQL